MVTRKNVAIVAICTAFVLGFGLVTYYATLGVSLSNPQTFSGTTIGTCTVSQASCGNITVVAASLTIANYTDELGGVSYSNLTVTIRPDQGVTLASVTLLLGGNVKVEEEEGPFASGETYRISTVLPENVNISPGTSYLLLVEGPANANQTGLGSIVVTAETN